MNKTICKSKWLFSLVLLAVSALSLTSCGDDDEQIIDNSTLTLYGQWVTSPEAVGAPTDKYSSVCYDFTGQTVMKTLMKMKKDEAGLKKDKWYTAMEQDIIVTPKNEKEGEVTLLMSSMVMPKIGKKKLTNDSDDVTYTYKLDKNTLTLTMSGTPMSFKLQAASGIVSEGYLVSTNPE